MGNCFAFLVAKPATSPENCNNAAAIGQIVTPDLKIFTVAELSSATKRFKPDTILGAGGFGTVFKGWVDKETLAPAKVGRGIPVAVKRSTPDSSQGFREWQSEVKYLGKFNHPNLVKLLGYCCEEREFYLVYEYMQKGSLDSHLFSKGEPLPWDTRLQIAIGAARGMSFLHAAGNAVIFRDFKPSNVLLDGDFNAKLSDFGLAKPGPSDGNSHLTTGVVGTYGYAAPEYVATGHLYVKSDVYGFGVVLLEMMTGRRVLDLNRPNKEHNLVEWAKPFLCDARKLKKILDPRLEGQIPSNASVQLAQLILNCLRHDPKTRPSMEDVLQRLVKIHAIKMKPNKSNPNAGKPTPQPLEQPPNHHRHGHQRSPYHHQHDAARARADRHSPRALPLPH